MLLLNTAAQVSGQRLRLGMIRGYKVEDDKVWARKLLGFYHCDYRAEYSGDVC